MKKPRRIWQSLSLVILFVLPLVLGAAHRPETGSAHKYLAYVGTYTEGQSRSKGIYVYRYDPQAGTFESLGVAAETVNPSFMATDPSRRFLYAVNELQKYDGQSSGGVSAFSIDDATGKLTFLNEVASGGADPCYITVDHTGKYVLVANYTGGSLAVFPIDDGGRLGARTDFIQHTGHGVNPERQEGPHVHYVSLSPDNRFAFVNDLGLDELFVYHFDANHGKLTPANPPYVKLAAGSGPRHFALSPNGKFAYVISEMKSTVTVFRYANGGLQQEQTISSLPSTFTGHNDDAEVEIHPSGKFLYGSNRGHDSIAAFAIDPATGKLSVIEYVPTQGKTPRSFEIDPSGKLLLAENQASNTIVVFRIDQQTGKLSPTGQVLDVPSPVCVKFVEQD